VCAGRQRPPENPPPPPPPEKPPPKDPPELDELLGAVYEEAAPEDALKADSCE
jgi:hypothetical protein